MNDEARMTNDEPASEPRTRHSASEDRAPALLPCRLIIDPPGEGAWNMALDEALLDQAADDGTATLRLYQWTEPTLSLGYFQAYAERAEHPESQGCPVVRRHSGGGAILHDHELTYSLALPAGAHATRDPFALYEAVHQSLRDCLVQLSGGNLYGRIDLCPAAIPAAGGREPFLCFARRARGDLLVVQDRQDLPRTPDGRHKVTGSSQRKRRGTVLQHGSILLGVSPLAPSLPGLGQLAGEGISADQIAQKWPPALAAALGLAISTGALGEGTLERAAEIRDSRFGQTHWTKRR